MDTALSIPSNRNTKIDSAKTVLIFCVILGHALRVREPDIFNSINMVVKLCIYSFHMPLFVIISGYLCNTKYSQEKLFKKSIELLASLAVFQIIRLFIEGKHSIADILTPQYTLWYLLCLVYWRVAVYYLSKYLSVGTILLLSIIISLGAGYIHLGHALSFQRAFSFFPFFVIGYFCRTQGLIHKIDKVPVSLSFLSLLIAAVVCVLAESFLHFDMLRVFTGSYSYSNNTDVFIRGGWLLVTIVISIAVYRLIPDRKSLEKYGTYTLAIYLLHTFFVDGFDWLVDHHYLFNDLITNVVGSLVIFFICVFLSRFKIIKKLTKPISFK